MGQKQAWEFAEATEKNNMKFFGFQVQHRKNGEKFD